MGKIDVTIGVNRTATLTRPQAECLNSLLFGGSAWVACISGVSVRSVDFQITESILPKFNADSIEQIRMEHILGEPNYRAECKLQGRAFFKLPEVIKLSPTELEVANLLFIGLFDEEAAELLKCTAKTFSFHCLNIKQKLMPMAGSRVSSFDIACGLLNYGFPFLDGETIGNRAVSIPSDPREIQRLFLKPPPSRVLQRMKFPDPLDTLEP